jgi:hypothetical protein
MANSNAAQTMLICLPFRQILNPITTNMKLKAAAMFGAMLCFALTSKADKILRLDESFASGATFSGDLTFNADYSNLVAVNGLLQGGTYGSDSINRIWDLNYNFAALGGYGPNMGGNFLMDSRPGGGFNYFITLTWDFSNASNLLVVTPGPILSSTGGNNVSYFDPLVAGRFSSASVPEGDTHSLVFCGVAMLGFARFARRK